MFITLSEHLTIETPLKCDVAVSVRRMLERGGEVITPGNTNCEKRKAKKTPQKA